MKYKITKERWDAVSGYLDKVIENPNKYPDSGVIISLSDDETTKLFTKRRLELIRLIQRKKPGSVTELSKLVQRRLTAVLRDLELLEGFSVISLEKKGKMLVPRVVKGIIILPLIKLEPKALAEIKAKA